MRNIKTLTVLFGLLALVSVAYTVPAIEQKDDNEEVKSLMENLLKGVVVQMQEDDDEQSSVKLQSAMRDMLTEVQDDEGDDDLSALLQGEEDEGDKQEDDDGDVILALLQDDEDEDDNGAVTQEDRDEADTQGFFRKLFRGVRRFTGRFRGIWNKVNRYGRYLNCIPRMQAEMQRADDGDEALGKNLLKRIANAQEDDAEAQFFKRLFRGVRKIWSRGRRFFKRVRSKFGRIYRGYRSVRKCIRRYG